MSYVTPRTFVAGEIETAAIFNTHLRDNIDWLATSAPACSAYRTTAQSCGNTADISVSLDAELFDNAAMHSTSSNTSRITMPTGGDGKYISGGSIDWAANVTGYRKVAVKKNATTEVARDVRPTTNTGACTQLVERLYSFVAGDYIELKADQNSGGALNVAVAADYSPILWAVWQRT